jgi:pyruvate/2-oxoglutarate dehydrogenase complex dihydrolipoamide acyltransferase (E2) component
MPKASDPKKPTKAAKPDKTETAGKPSEDHTAATGLDHPSQSEHAKALWEKLHGTSDQRLKGAAAPAASVPGKKKGFDPHQFKGGKGGFGGAGNSMMRRTQSRGGGGGSGGGGGGGGGGAA